MKKTKCILISLLILLAVFTFINLYQNLDYNNKLVELLTTNPQLKGKTDGFSVKQDRIGKHITNEHLERIYDGASVKRDRNEKYVTNTHLKRIADDVSVKRDRNEKYVTNTHLKRIADDVSVKRDRNEKYATKTHLKRIADVASVKRDRNEKYATNTHLKRIADDVSVKRDSNQKYATNTHLKRIADDVSVKRDRSEKYATNTHLTRIADDVSLKRDRNNGYTDQLQKTGGVQIKLDRNEKYNWSYTGQLNADYMPFAPAINTTEYTMLLDLIKRVKDAFETFNITYMLEGGSVLGSYMHHGFIPWDDDIDLKVNISQQKILKKAMEDIPGHTLHSPNNSLWKFFNNNFSKAGQSDYKWPVIDIFFFQVNETHVNDVTPNRLHFSDPKSDILPLENGIFEGMVFPVPRNMEAYLNRRYKMHGQCLSHHWSHRTESRRKSLRMRCHKLFGVYPIVHQFQFGNTTFEELRLGNKVLYTVERSSLKLLKPRILW